jgi:DNA invertase Pin-like site-specific DNA recombinase
LLGEFTEVESGKRKNRPELNAALALAKKQKAILIIAKLDRLARNLHFISGLLEAGVDFVAVDNPNANRLTVQILAAVAENEARAISERTKAALASAKARGTKLGSHGAVLGAENRKKALATLEAVRPVLGEIDAAGIKTVRGIAKELNRRNVPTPTGGRWHPTSVHRLLSRMN